MSKAAPIILVALTLLVTSCENQKSDAGSSSNDETTEERSDETPPETESAADEKTEEEASERQPRDEESREPAPLAEALTPPEDAVTSEGRFRELAERGMRDKIPKIGLVYASAGIEQPAVRVIVTADGHAEWARGKGAYWDDLPEIGSFELSQADVETLARLVAESWTVEPEYPPSNVRGTRVVIIRHRDTARVFEHSALPAHLEPLEDLLLADRW